ncbi:MAG: MOSC domain-containing protein [Acidobacteriota bacterium]
MELAEVVGSLAGLRRFPIEPLGGEAANVAPVSGSGLLGDRAYVLCDEATGEPVLTGSAPLILFYGARFLDDMVERDLDTWTRVRDPSGAEMPIGDPRWLEDLGRLLGRPLSLRPRAVDAAAGPLRLITRATLRLAERSYGAPLEPLRVRANLLVEVPDGKAFEEDKWVGRRIGIGDTVLEITGPAADCFVSDFESEIPRGDAAMLRGLVGVRRGHLGVAARAIAGHRIRVGDPVALHD